MTDIEFRYIKVSRGYILQYRKYINNSWSEWFGINRENINENEKATT